MTITKPEKKRGYVAGGDADGGKGLYSRYGSSVQADY
jgi:hypothetical protein